MSAPCHGIGISVLQTSSNNFKPSSRSNITFWKDCCKHSQLLVSFFFYFLCFRYCFTKKVEFYYLKGFFGFFCTVAIIVLLPRHLALNVRPCRSVAPIFCVSPRENSHTHTHTPRGSCAALVVRLCLAQHSLLLLPASLSSRHRERGGERTVRRLGKRNSGWKRRRQRYRGKVRRSGWKRKKEANGEK